MTTAVVDSPTSEEAQAWWFLDTLVVEHRCAPGMDTVVLEMTLPVGAAPPLHVHDDLDDTWYILDGEMVVRCGDDELVVGAGHWVSMPRGVPHTFRVVGAREARSCWCTTTPAFGTSSAMWALRPRRASFPLNRCSPRWTSWHESPPHTTSGRSGPP
jgi:mannose-6-phosphate isomerase-like protein (cupin superfamily)